MNIGYKGIIENLKVISFQKHIISETQPRAGGGGYAEFSSHTHEIHNDYTKTRIMTDTWHIGDKVMLIPIVGDDESTAEQYFVYGKCRRLDGNE